MNKRVEEKEEWVMRGKSERGVGQGGGGGERDTWERRERVGAEEDRLRGERED